MKKYWQQHKILLAVTLCIGIIGAVCNAFVAIVLQKIIDAAVSGESAVFMKTVVFTVVYVAVLCLLSYLGALASKYLLLNMSRQLRQDVFYGILRRRPMQFWQVDTADYTSALTNDIRMLEENYILTVLNTIELVALFFATLMILLYLSPLVTMILLFNLALIFLIPALFGRLLEKRQAAISKQQAVYTATLQDIFLGYDVVRSYGIRPQMEQRFKRENEKTVQRRFAADRMFALNDGLSETMSTLSIVVVIAVSAYLVLRGNITMGTLLALTQLSGTFMAPVMMLLQNIPKISSMKPVIARLQELADGKVESWSGTGQPSFQQTVELQNISFAYDEAVPVLKNITLCFKQGKKYALLGPSGCGKTTLIKLLSGYSNGYTGKILYDGQELRTLSDVELTQLFSLVHQNVYLFSGSVRDNITLGEDFSEEQLRQAIADSGADTFAYQLPQGLDTDAGENGSNLSGGQRQRIGLARAFLRQTHFIVLDEGTSAVDKRTAAEIENRLLRRENLTLLTITHTLQPELLRQYDEIIYLEQGCVLGQGSYDELATKNSRFQAFIQ